MLYTKNKPLVSVAIVTYNHKEFLRECIESVLIQDYEPIQIIVADDASTDGTQEMLLEYNKQYPNKFKLCLSKENKGITSNCNAAHFACDGKYTAWIGGDDIMLPGKISAQVELMESDDSCAICHHELDIFDSDTGNTINLFTNHVKKGTPLEGGLKELIKYGAICAISPMVRHSSTPVNGFDERLTIVSDALYFMETIKLDGTFRFIPSCFGRYRRHSNNITNPFNPKRKIFEQEHLMTLDIVQINYPMMSSEIAYHRSIYYIGLAKKYPDYYWNYNIQSLRNRTSLKVLLKLLIYILSFKSVKK